MQAPEFTEGWCETGNSQKQEALKIFWITYRKHGVQGLDHENAVRHIPNYAESLEPMEEVFVEEHVDSVVQWFVVTEFDVTSLKMVDPIPARVLNLQGETTLYSARIHFNCEDTRKL